MPRSAIATGVVDLVLPVAEMPDALVKYDAATGAAAHATRRRRIDAHGLPARHHRSSAHEDRPRFHALQAGHAAAPDRAAHGDGGDRDRRHGALSGDSAQRRQRARSACQGSAHQRHQLFPRSQGVRPAGGEDRSGPGPQPPGRSARCASGSPAAARARKPIRLRCSSTKQIAAAKRNVKLQVFASDVDPDAVASAREGLYPETIEADVSPERLARFFTKEEHGYRVSPELRAAWCSRCRMCWPIRRSRGSIWFRAAIC